MSNKIYHSQQNKSEAVKSRDEHDASAVGYKQVQSGSADIFTTSFNMRLNEISKVSQILKMSNSRQKTKSYILSLSAQLMDTKPSGKRGVYDSSPDDIFKTCLNAYIQ